jgi:mRNA interferase MazF
MLCCPMTSQKKGYPFEVVISEDPHRTSVVLADQVKSLDWKTRKAIKKGTASPTVLLETLSKLQTLF